MARPNNDSAYLNALRDYYAENRVLPSYAKIARLLGFRSKNAAMKLVKRLVDCGFLRRTGENRIAPTEGFLARPMAQEKVAAGQPAAASDTGGDVISIDQVLIRKPSRTVLVSVKGDSMTDAGILDGDIAVVERGLAARKGDFVVAMVDNEFTLKELSYEQGKPILRPHNRAYPTIRPTTDLEIVGVVVAQFRSYTKNRPRVWLSIALAGSGQNVS